MGGVLYARDRRAPRRHGIRARLRDRLNLPPAMADSVIDDYIDRLKQKHPGRTEQWYLEKAEYDLTRDG